MYRVWNFLTEYSLLLIIGAIVGLIWANLDFIIPVVGNSHYYADLYHNLVEYVIWDYAPIGHFHDGHRTLTVHYLINDMLMALFFAIAGKEVWEAVILKNGSLRGRKSVTPLIATVGGMVGPVSVYLGLALIMGTDTYQAVANGWAIPTATDIAFSYLVGRLVFGAGHPAVGFLLLLAIADDAAGLIILAVFYPSGELAPQWLLLSVFAGVAVFFLCNWLPRRLDRGNQGRPYSTWMRTRLSALPYAIAGAASWYGFMRAGIHPSLGLLPIVPAIPHADRAFGIFSSAEEHLHDLLNTIEHALKKPVEVILLFFGFANAGVQFTAIGSATWLVLLGLLVGKPLGIWFMGWLAARPLGFGLPEGMKVSDLFVLGCVAAIGFTVSLFIATVAFPVDAGASPELQALQQTVLDGAKMGALLSFVAAIVSLIVGRLFRVERQHL